jgi:hypothetical protein
VWIADVALATPTEQSVPGPSLGVLAPVVALDAAGQWTAGDAAAHQPRERQVTSMQWWTQDARAEVAGVGLTGAAYVAALVLAHAALVRSRARGDAELVQVTVLTPGNAWTGLPAALSFALPDIDVHVVATAQAASGPTGRGQVVDWRGGAPEVSLVEGEQVTTTMLERADGLAAALDANTTTLLVAPASAATNLVQWLRASMRIDESVAIEEVLARVARSVGPASDEQRVAVDDDVQFSVYRPRVVRPAVPEKLVAFAHKSDVYEEDGRVVDPTAEVARQAEAVLGDLSRHAQTIADSNVPIMRGDTLRFVPVVDGIEFNPTALEFRWVRGVHREVFEFRADPSLDGRVASGRMSVFLGMVLIADVSLRIRVDSAAPDPAPDRTRANVYGKVFPSYSHNDKLVVDQVISAARTLGHTYLRDVDQLRSGQDWQREIENFIDQADIFQLFWSPQSMYSPHVRHEWTYALSLGRPDFIRPVYWEVPRPSAPPDLPPPDLDRLHFMYLAGDETPVGPPELAPVSAPPPRYAAPAGAATSGPMAAAPAPVSSRKQRRFAGAAAGVAVAAAATVAITLGVSGPGAVVGLGRGSATPTVTAAPTITAASSTFNDSVPPTGRVPDLAQSQLAVAEFFSALNRDDIDAALALVCTQSQNEFRTAFDNLRGVAWSVPHLIGHRAKGEELLLRYTIKRQSGSATRRFRLLITMISENLHPVICAITG